MLAEIWAQVLALLTGDGGLFSVITGLIQTLLAGLGGPSTGV